jgi:hypothetical protein
MRAPKGKGVAPNCWIEVQGGGEMAENGVQDATEVHASASPKLPIQASHLPLEICFTSFPPALTSSSRFDSLLLVGKISLPPRALLDD